MRSSKADAVATAVATDTATDTATGTDTDTDTDTAATTANVNEDEPPTTTTSCLVVAANKNANKKKKRRVSLTVGFVDVDAVYEIPHRNDYDANNICKEELFYSDADYERFRTSEQKRFDKLVAKKLQKMVMEKMQPKINEAVASGATLEDIEAMVPKTHAEMVAYLGLTKKNKLSGGSSSFGGLSGSNKTKTNQRQQQQKTIRSSRSSIQATNTTTTTETTITTTTENPQSVNDSDNDNAVKNEGTTDRKRAIRSSRSSIEIITTNPRNSNNGGGRRMPSLLEAAVIATEMAAELIALEGEETGEDGKDSLLATAVSTSGAATNTHGENREATNGA